MSLRITLDYQGVDLSGLQDSLANSTELNARVAGDAERFMKREGPRLAAGKHRTAETLGATPTGHLGEAYEGIEGISDATAATLLVPAASRLRAAFGAYVLTPKKSEFLTLPAHREAYGRRAREFDDLFPMRVGPKQTLVLARRVEGSRDESLRTRTNQRRQSRRFTQAEIMYVLVTKANIPADETLIPFAELADEARDSAEAYLNEAIERSLT